MCLKSKVIYKIFPIIFVFGFLSLESQDIIPDRPASWVNDYAQILSAAEKTTLDDMLNGLEKRSSNQIFIALFDRLPEDQYLEDFVVKLYDKWRPGLPDQGRIAVPKDTGRTHRRHPG